MKSIVALFCLFVLVSCQKEIDPPVAKMEVPAGNIKAGVAVTFKNTSTNANSAEWDFGDTSTIVKTSAPEVVHTFKTGGTF